MDQVTATELTQKTAQILERVQCNRQPIRVERHRRLVAILIHPDDWERLIRWEESQEQHAETTDLT